ncbi:MAG TPA: cytochrome P450 [Candidatus Binataceae bacterium]|nr:cytochrome P450 [Candidatus Binataceae bacterium]
MADEFYFNPFDPAFRANPYPFYKPLYAGPPRLIDFYGPTLLVARHADVAAVWCDPERFSSEPPTAGSRPSDRSMFGGPVILLLDPPAHTRLRRLVSHLFTPRKVREGLAAAVDSITRRLLDHAAEKGEFDAVTELADPLPTMVIAHVLGFPIEDHRILKEWSDLLLDGLNTPPDQGFPPSYHKALDERDSYLSDIMEKRRSKPQDDLISMLLAAQEEGDKLSTKEVIGFINLLLLAGNETTTNLISSALLHVIRHPGQHQLLRDNPQMAAAAIEEVLRYDCPVQALGRTARVDMVFADTRVPANTRIYVLAGASGRDPAKFRNPDTFDITRESNEHLAFGLGIHFCLGASLARLEGTTALRMSVERFPHLQMANPDAALGYKGSFETRGLRELKLVAA